MKNTVTRILAIAWSNLLASIAHADAVGLPPMNLGNTSFLDGIAAPGFLFELSTSYYRAPEIKDNAGSSVPSKPRVETAVIVPHIAYISPDVTLLGGNLGAEVLLPLVYANIRTGAGTGDHNFAAGDVSSVQSIHCPVVRADAVWHAILPTIRPAILRAHGPIQSKRQCKCWQQCLDGDAILCVYPHAN
jgi:hypothetical protein